MRFKQWLSIKKDQNARGLLLAYIVVFNIGLWLFSSLLAFLLHPDLYDNVVRALWESGITWMLEPGFYNPDLPYAIRIMSIIVIITSMITFSGGIIGYVANLFSSIIDNAKQGKNKLYIENHMVLLNWNYKALELIADYRYDEDTTTVVVLSHLDKEEVEKDIYRKLYAIPKTKKKLNIIVRQGEVFSISDLHKICIEKAKSVIILSDESHEYTTTHIDVLAMKTLMLISQLKLQNIKNVLVEVKEQQTVKLIHDYIAKNSDLGSKILPILPDELMGRLIAQTLLMPELNKVYKELFSFDGVEFYSIPKKDPLNFIKMHTSAIPIYELNDQLYVLSENKHSIEHTRQEPLSAYHTLKFNGVKRYIEKHIVIFGSNHKLPFILDSISLYDKENKTQTKVTLIDSNDPNMIKETTSKLSQIDHILILSADDLKPEEYDSDVLVTLLMTQELAKKHHAEIIIELLDPRHFDIAQSYNVHNTIISNEYISHIMTQLSKNCSLYHLFIDLLTYDAENSDVESYEVYAYKAEQLIDETFPLSFKSTAEAIYSFYQSGDKDYIFIGMMKDRKLIMFKGNLDEQTPLEINAQDYLIMICK